MNNLRKINNTLYYDYCNFKGHTRETSYKLNGYPPDFKSKKKYNPAGNFAKDSQCVHTGSTVKASNLGPTGGYFGGTTTNFAGSTSTTGDAFYSQNQSNPVGVPHFTPEQYSQILQLLGKGSESNEATMAASMDNNVTDVTDEAVRFIKSIVDLGATNHMVRSLNFLTDSTPSDKFREGKVLLPTENLATVKHIGTTYIFQDR